MAESPSNPAPGPGADVRESLKKINQDIRDLQVKRLKLIFSKPFDWEKDLEELAAIELPPKPHRRWGFSGVDTMAIALNKPNLGVCGAKALPEVQGVSWSHVGSHITGSIVSVVDIHSLWPSLPAVVGDLVLQTSTEYGNQGWLLIRDVRIIERGGGVSIDDITTEDVYTYTASEVLGWFAGRAYNVENNEYTLTDEFLNLYEA